MTSDKGHELGEMHGKGKWHLSQHLVCTTLLDRCWQILEMAESSISQTK
ncbi:hypothetical protein [Hydrococcus rivularis]|nr:hypothetical protein [Hydrococcus rivularis]